MVADAGGGARLLVVDDDRHLLRAIRTTLSGRGYQVHTAEAGGEALESFFRTHPDLLILDLDLGGADGLEVIGRVRQHSQTPIVVLSSRSDEGEKIRALDLGADDYLTKPFGVGELVARVRVALRHAARPERGTAAVIHAGPVEVDLDRRRVRVRGQDVHLSPTEYELVKLFVSNPDRVLTHHWLLQRVWGPRTDGSAGDGSYLHVYVAGLRKKLEADPHRPRHLLTEAGVGYRFQPEPDERT